MIVKSQDRIAKRSVLALSAMLWAIPVFAGGGSDMGTQGHAMYVPEQLAFPLKAAWISREIQPPWPSFCDSVWRPGPRATETKAIRAEDHRRMSVYHRQGLAEPATYDYGLRPVVAGGRVYVASSSDESLFCLDAASGRRLWTVRAEGPVRFAPLVRGDRVYFCSDDGSVYCANAASGAPVWKRRIAPHEGCALNNVWPISAWPVRGGLAWHDGRIYCAAGLFPEQGVFLAALDAETGVPAWNQRSPNTINGPLLADRDTLWTPTHRTTPCLYRLADGRPQLDPPPVLLGRGAAQIWKLDRYVAWGPDEGGLVYLQLTAENKGSGAKMKRGGQSPLGVVSVLHAWCALTSPTHFVWVQGDRVIGVRIEAFRAAMEARLVAMNTGREPPADMAGFGKLMGSIAAPDRLLGERLEKAAAWTIAISEDAQFRAALIAGNALILGGRNEALAVDLRSGEELGKVAAEGQVWGLAAAGGSLYVGTDTGIVQAFRPGAQEKREWPADRAEPKDTAFSEAAKRVVEHSGRTRGVCLVAGGGTGALAAAIARQSDYRLIVIEPDAQRAAAQRDYLETAGLYGRRVVVRHETGARLAGYPFGFANLIVSEEAFETGRIPYASKAILPLLQPYGGVIAVGASKGAPDLAAWKGMELGAWQPLSGAKGEWRAARRGPLPGGGQWPTANGSSGNSMCSGEIHVPAAASAMRLQWFGEPFAKEIIDRHAVPMTPLVNRGTALLLGLHDTLIAQAPYNGTILWRRVVPGIERVLASHNSSPFAISSDGRWAFAISGAECLQLDVLTGEPQRTLKETADGADWGFIGPCGDLLIGTSQPAMDFASTGGRQVSALKDWSASAPAASRDLFAVDIETGRKRWTHTEGVILNPTIAMDDGRIYFAQSLNAAARSNRAGNMKMGDWIARDEKGGAEIVALDAGSGRVLWRVPIDPERDAESHWIMYLTAWDGRLLATRTMFRGEGNEFRRGYRFDLFDAKTGQSRWAQWHPSQGTTRHAGLGYGKNSLSSRPIIIGDRFYIRANLDAKATKGLVYTFDLATGEAIGKPVDTGTHDAGCSVASGSINTLYYRNYQHEAFDVKTRTAHRLTGATRPSCWPNTLPVGGILYAPEGGAGCSCGVSYQLSFALAPERSTPE